MNGQNNLKNTKKIWLLILGILFLVACNQNDAATDNQNTEAQSLTFENLGQGDSFIAEIEEPIVFLDTNEEQTERYIPWLVDNPEIVEELDSIDYENRVVLAVFRGMMPSSGYSISVRTITADNDTLKITVELSDPGPDQFLSTVISYPYTLISFSNSEINDNQINKWLLYRFDGTQLAEGSFSP